MALSVLIVMGSDSDLEQALTGAGLGPAEDPEGEALGSAGEQVRATRALAPLLRRYSALEPRDARNRCAAALARRGFDYETISRVVAAALAPVPDGRDDV